MLACEAVPGRVEVDVKKLLLVAAVAGAAVLWRRKASAKAERDLWAEATDPVR